MTVGDLKRIIKNLPDDYQLEIEVLRASTGEDMMEYLFESRVGRTTGCACEIDTEKKKLIIPSHIDKANIDEQ